ncbi:MAG: hypothetical protein ACK4SY_09275, partial [Pyrobaculum sp.]
MGWGQKVGGKRVGNAIVCPRCGQPGRIYVTKKQTRKKTQNNTTQNGTQEDGVRKYYYVMHSENGQVRYCHLGPEAYIYVSRVHSFEFRGYKKEYTMMPLKRFIDYINEMAAILEKQRDMLTPELCNELRMA